MCAARWLGVAGKFYVVNGEKKWITNGVFADYFTVAVRTGGPGMGGLSLLLLERGMPGLQTKQMQCMGVWSSGTTYITMEDVKVPVENLIGEENGGTRARMRARMHQQHPQAPAPSLPPSLPSRPRRPRIQNYYE